MTRDPNRRSCVTPRRANICCFSLFLGPEVKVFYRVCDVIAQISRFVSNWDRACHDAFGISNSRRRPPVLGDCDHAARSATTPSTCNHHLASESSIPPNLILQETLSETPCDESSLSSCRLSRWQNEGCCRSRRIAAPRWMLTALQGQTEQGHLLDSHTRSSRRSPRFMHYC